MGMDKCALLILIPTYYFLNCSICFCLLTQHNVNFNSEERFNGEENNILLKNWC